MTYRLSIAALLVLAAFSAPQSGAVAADSAWSRAGSPVEATGSFLPPPPGIDVVPEKALDAYAQYEDFSRGGIFDEVRLGVLGFWQTNADSVEGVYVTGQVLFDPFVDPYDNWILNILLRPRPHLGGTVSPDGPDQIFAGLTWTFPIGRLFFAEASLGGTVHNGPLSGHQVSLGCHLLFRESLGVGVNLGQHWRVMAGVDHSSHADLCDGENDGLTHLGGYVGYRF
jgi:hypothetical protein